MKKLNYLSTKGVSRLEFAIAKKIEGLNVYGILGRKFVGEVALNAVEAHHDSVMMYFLEDANYHQLGLWNGESVSDLELILKDRDNEQKIKNLFYIPIHVSQSPQITNKVLKKVGICRTKFDSRFQVFSDKNGYSLVVFNAYNRFSTSIVPTNKLINYLKEVCSIEKADGPRVNYNILPNGDICDNSTHKQLVCVERLKEEDIEFTFYDKRKVKDYPLEVIKELLTVVSNNKDLIVDRSISNTGLSIDSAYNIFIQLIQEGYIKEAERGIELTLDGIQLMHKSLKRIKKTTMERYVAEFFDKIELINSNPNFAVKVKEVYFFGSYIRDNQKDYGDLDVVVTFAKKRLQKRQKIEDCYDRFLQLYNNGSLDFKPKKPSYFGWNEEEIALLFLKYQRPAISLTYLNTLKSRGFPCKLVYKNGKMVSVNYTKGI